jgi:hypothetical protein
MTTRDMLLRIVLTLIPAVLIYALVRLETREDGLCRCGHDISGHACGVGCLTEVGDENEFCPCARCGDA